MSSVWTLFTHALMRIATHVGWTFGVWGRLFCDAQVPCSAELEVEAAWRLVLILSLQYRDGQSRCPDYKVMENFSTSTECPVCQPATGMGISNNDVSWLHIFSCTLLPTYTMCSCTRDLYCKISSARHRTTTKVALVWPNCPRCTPVWKPSGRRLSQSMEVHASSV